MEWNGEPVYDWQIDGVKFTCTACGACCKGEGFAFLNEDDLQRLADHLGISTQQAAKRHCEPVLVDFDDGDQLAYLVLRKTDDNACIF